MNSKNIVIICIISLFSQLAFAQSSDLKKTVDDYINYLTKENSFLGDIEMRKGNDVIYSYSSIHLRPKDGRYKIGSITKIFTAAIVFQLIEENKLTLDTKLNKFYPKIKNSEIITVENLLSHTSGIYNFTEWEDYYTNRNQTFTKENVLNIIYTGKPAFKPNKDCIYSNSNYLLLGYLIEDITGKDYATNVKERISDKIGVKDSYVPQNAQEVQNINSYMYDGEKWIADLQTDPGLTFAAGTMVSTVSDLNKFLDKLFHGNLISKKSLEIMQTLKSPAIGHGIFKLPFYEKIGWGHSGKTDEFHSVTSYFPSEDLYLSITSNGIRGKLNNVMIAIMSLYYNKKFDYPKFFQSEVTNPPLSTFKGSYNAKLAGFVTIGKFYITPAENNYLFMGEIKGNKYGEKTLLERIDANTFYSRIANARLTFVVNGGNVVKKMIINQGKMTINAYKSND